jgi:dUTP pyrophosphatase
MLASIYSYLNSLLAEHQNRFSVDSTTGNVDGLITVSAGERIVPRDFALLKICVSGNRPGLGDLYRQHVETHNTKVLTSFYPDAGFDLFIPEATSFSIPFQNQMIGLGIRTEMVYFSPGRPPLQCGFDMRPRSSISKSQLILSNHLGTVDAGYRGELIGAFRWLPASHHSYEVEASTRLLQICHPTLCPILVVVVDSEADLTRTERGDGGFGSTGRVGQLA